MSKNYEHFSKPHLFIELGVSFNNFKKIELA